MNILQIRGSFEDNGPGTQTLTISTELRRRGHKVTLCSSGGLLKEKIIENKFDFLEIKELALNKRNFLNVIKAINKLRTFFANNNIEVVHAHNAASMYIAYFASILAFKKIKFFHSCRGVELRKNYQWRNWIYKIYPAKLFAVCQFTKDILMSFGVNKDKIIVTYNGVDLKRFKIEDKKEKSIEIRNELNIPIDATVIGIIGRMEVKGHDLLVEAFSKLYSDYPNLYLVLVGSGPEYDFTLNLAKQLGVEERVRFTGFRTDIERLHASFDIFALLSKYGEMFPNAILESLSYGTPFVSSKLSGIPEIAERGCGIVCEIGNVEEIKNALIELLTNDELRNRMSLNALKCIQEEFNIEVVVDKIENAYKS